MSVLAGPLLDVATKPPLSIVSLGWKVGVGSGVVLLLACVGAFGVRPDMVPVHWA